MLNMDNQVIESHGLLLADECWLGLALLHRAYPQRTSFTAREIVDCLKREKAHPELRAGVQAHIYQHNVANVEPSSARYRMFYRLADGTYRLFRPGDTTDTARKGKTMPERSDLPMRYHEILDWYQKEYCGRAKPQNFDDDPVLQMRGIGKELWERLGGGDAFVARERAGWDHDSESAGASPPEPALQVWSRIVAHQREQFRTVTGLTFTYRVEGENGMWFYRDGKRINQRLARGEIDKAVERCPLQKTTDISDLRDYAYLFALLNDKRIRGTDW